LGLREGRFDSCILDMAKNKDEGKGLDGYQENAIIAFGQAKDAKEETEIVKDMVRYERHVKGDKEMKKKKN
jgi:hypothetical protein